MTNRTGFYHRLYLPALLALAPIVITLGFISRAFFLFRSLETTIVFILQLLLFCVSTYLAGKVEKHLWAGYILLATTTSWLILGIEPTLLMIMLGNILTYIATWIIIERRASFNWNEAIYQVLSRIAISGLSVCVAFFIYTFLGGNLPLINPQAEQVFPMLVSISTGFLCTLLVGSLLVRQYPFLLTRMDRRSLLLELLMLFVPLALAPVYYQLGIMSFFIFMILAVAQVNRYSQVNRTQNALEQRVRELSILNSVGQSISANIEMDDVLMSIYREVQQLATFTSFLIVLYDEARDMLDYRLVITQGHRTHWPSRKLSDGATDVVIRNKTTLLIHKNDLPRLQQLSINPDKVESAVYLGIPLMVGPKIIGVMSMLHADNPEALQQADINILQIIANQAGLAVRNATLYDRTMRLAQHLSLINQSVQDVMFNLDSDEAMMAACQMAIKITQAQKAAVFLLDTDKQKQPQRAQSVGFTESQFDQIIYFITESNHPGTNALIVHDIGTLTDVKQQEIAKQLQFQSSAAIPLRSGNTVIGYMAVYHELPHYYSSPELDLLEMMANQVAAALDNSELLKALELYASEQAQLVHLSRISTASLELERVIHNVSDVLKQMIDLAEVQVAMLIPGKNRLRIFTADEAMDSLFVAEMPVDKLPEIQEFLQGETQALETYQIHDEHLSSSLVEYMQERHIETLSLVPMVINLNTLGIILLGDTHIRYFSDNDRRLIEMATNQVTTQIHNAQIFTMTEEALVQRLQQLSLIEDIAQQISRSLDLDIIIRNVLEAALRATQADLATLALATPDGFRVIGQDTISQKPIEFDRLFARHEGVIGEVTRTANVMVIPDNRKLPYYISPIANRTFLSSLAVPLILDDVVIGVINVESAQVDFFNDEQASFIKSLAGHATISINNARLLEDRQQQIETLTSLRDLSLQIAATTDKNTVTRALLRTVLKVMQGKGSLLFYLDTETQEILLRGSLEIENGIFRGARIFVPDGVIREAMKTSKLQIIEDITRNPHYMLYPDLDQMGYTSIVVIPIERSHQISEVICTTYDKVVFFNERQRSTLDLLTIQAAGYLENITLNEKLRANNDRMRAILDSTGDGIILMDKEMRLVESNIAAERMLGLRLYENIGENFARLLFEHTNTTPGDENSPGIEEELRNMARILRTEPQRITQREYVLFNQGQPRYIKEVGSTVLDTNGNVIGRLLALHDISEDKALEKYRERISNMVYHDLRSPLSAIISGLTFALDLLGMMDDGQDKTDLTALLDITCLKNANIALRRVNNLLDIAKGDQLVPKKESVPVSQIVETTLVPKSASYRDANITLEQDVPQELMAFADADLVERILDNLLDNSLRYTPEGGTVRVVGDIWPNNPRFVRIRVCDTGPGIPPDKREHIFKEFEQIDGSKPQRGAKGSGLGLAFCKLAAIAHGGDIWVETEGPLPGACIAFTLPIATQLAPTLSELN